MVICSSLECMTAKRANMIGFVATYVSCRIKLNARYEAHILASQLEDLTLFGCHKHGTNFFFLIFVFDFILFQKMWALADIGILLLSYRIRIPLHEIEIKPMLSNRFFHKSLKEVLVVFSAI